MTAVGRGAQGDLLVFANEGHDQLAVELDLGNATRGGIDQEHCRVPTAGIEPIGQTGNVAGQLRVIRGKRGVADIAISAIGILQPLEFVLHGLQGDQVGADAA